MVEICKDIIIFFLSTGQNQKTQFAFALSLQNLNLHCPFIKVIRNPSITDGVHHNENFVEIIPVFSTFSNFFKKKEKKYIKAILCNFSMRLLRYFFFLESLTTSKMRKFQTLKLSQFHKGKTCSLKNFVKVEKTGIISTKFSLRCTPSVILGTTPELWNKLKWSWL